LIRMLIPRRRIRSAAAQILEAQSKRRGLALRA
jgi:hypothetical protein